MNTESRNLPKYLKGDWMVIVGLKARPEFNGCEGPIHEIANGRLAISIFGRIFGPDLRGRQIDVSKPILLKPENVRHLSEFLDKRAQRQKFVPDSEDD